MTALAANRNTVERANAIFSFPIAASTKIYQGSIVCLNSSGLAVPGSTATTLKVVGRAEHLIDNSAGLASALQVDVKRGCFRFANGESITLANVGATAYITDDQTVCTTATGKSIAGIIRDVDADGVWVEI